MGSVFPATGLQQILKRQDNMFFCFHFLGTLSDPTAFYLGGEIHEKAIERCAGNQKAVQNRASTGKKLMC